MLTVIGMIESEWWGWATERDEEFIAFNSSSRALKTIPYETKGVNHSDRKKKKKEPEQEVVPPIIKESDAEKLEKLINLFGRET